MKKHLLILTVLTVALTSCNYIRAFKKMNSKSATLEEWRTESKTVVFIPMAHIGTLDFYRSVKNLVETKKAEGFIVYYESTGMKEIDDSSKQNLLKKSYLKYYSGSNHIDSISQMIYKKKMARLLGFFPGENAYEHFISESFLFKGKIVQPAYKELGLDDADKHVDVRQNKLVDKYEEMFGEIMLEERDFNLSLNSTYPKSYNLPKDKVNTIIIDYRNKNLAQYVQASLDKKIVVIYGMAHMRGTFDELKRLDRTWRKL